MTNFPLIIDGELSSLAAFIEANTDEDVMLEDELINEVKALEPGQACNLPIGGGWIEVKRPVEEDTNYDQWQLEKYGNVLSQVEVTPDGSCENGEDELRRQQEWVSMHEELELQQN
jgi:hypothetical protein